MIRIHPKLDIPFACPVCRSKLEVFNAHIPGMRCLAATRCKNCGKSYFSDLPAGHGLTYPMMIDVESGAVYNPGSVDWFAEWMRVSFANKVSSSPDIKVESFKPVRKAILLNCIDKLYGHCLLKLLNSQYYLDHYPDFDLVVVIQRPFRWLVPDGAAEIWTVDLPLSKGLEWNEGLASEISKRMEAWDECWLSAAPPHPHQEDFKIQQFSRIEPFPINEWTERFKKKPVVTFIWREDRIWESEEPSRFRIVSKDAVLKQRELIEEVFQLLKQDFPSLDFAVAGLGENRKFSNGILDLVSGGLNEERERLLCQRYADSHVVIGVHGSNMLLPSAHSGSVVEILPRDRWYNLIQDLLPAESDARLALCRYRILPMPVKPPEVANCTGSLLKDLPYALLNFRRDQLKTFDESDPWRISRERRAIR